MGGLPNTSSFIPHLMQGEGSPALERYREERAALARFDRLEREGMLVRGGSLLRPAERKAFDEALRLAADEIHRVARAALMAHAAPPGWQGT